MRTSLNEIRQIERHILGKIPPAEGVVWEARKIIQPGLQEKIKWQTKAYLLITAFGRKSLKKELEDVHHQLMSGPGHISFRKKVRQLFPNS